MDDTELAEIVECGNQLLKKAARFFFFQFVLRCYVAEELTIAAVLHD